MNGHRVQIVSRPVQGQALVVMEGIFLSAKSGVGCTVIQRSTFFTEYLNTEYKHSGFTKFSLDCKSTPLDSQFETTSICITIGCLFLGLFFSFARMLCVCKVCYTCYPAISWLSLGYLVHCMHTSLSRLQNYTCQPLLINISLVMPAMTVSL